MDKYSIRPGAVKYNESLQQVKLELDDLNNKLLKYRKALDILNDAYELGDYSRQEWLTRKKKREIEISGILSDIEDEKRLKRYKETEPSDKA